MSRLSELLNGRYPTAIPATPATNDRESSESSNRSNNSRPPLVIPTSAGVAREGSATNHARKTVEHPPSDLPPGLEARMRAMAWRWRCTADELAEVLELARRNHEGWLLAVALDERREAEFRAAGVFWWDA
jgi:hypothetical protein